MGNRGGHRPTLQAIPAKQSDRNIPGPLVPLDHRKLHNVLSRIMHPYPILYGDHGLSRFGDHPAGNYVDDPHMRVRKLQSQPLLCEVLYIHSTQNPLIQMAFIIDQHGSILGNQAAADIDLMHRKLGQVVAKAEIGTKPWSNGSPVTEMIAITAVDCSHADRLDRVQSGSNGEPDIIVDMAFTENAHGLTVIGTENAASAVTPIHPSKEGEYVVAGRTFTQHHIHAASDPLLQLLCCFTLMVGPDSGCAVCIQIRTVDGGTVTVDDFLRFLCFPQLVQNQGRTADHSGVIHHLTQPEHPFMLQRLDQVGSEHYRSTVFESGCWNTGRNNKKGLQGCLFRGVQHIGKSIKSADVANLVGVGNDGGCSTGNNKIAELLRGCMAGLYVDMAVYESWDHITPFCIHNCVCTPLSRLGISGKTPFTYQNISFKPLFVIYIQNMGIGNTELGFFSQ